MDTYSYVPQAIQTLRNVQSWMTKAEEHATAVGFDVHNLMAARLAPDQFRFCRQIQIIGDTAKLTAARLTGKTPPVHEDTETTFAELRQRLDGVIAYLEGLSESDFAGAEERPVALAFLAGHSAKGEDYLTQFAVPNLYFHLSTAYNILRHNGVKLGKQDFIGHLNVFPTPT